MSASKAAQVTVYFWVMKICATTLGETAGDLLSMTLKVGYAQSSMILMCVFLATLIAQMSSKQFRPFLYWAVVLSTSTAGTTLSDYMDRTLELGYAKGSLILALGLAATLSVWRYTEKSLSVDNIRSPRAELFYWTNPLLEYVRDGAGRFPCGRLRFGILRGRGAYRGDSASYYARQCVYANQQNSTFLACVRTNPSVRSHLWRFAYETPVKGRHGLRRHRLLLGSCGSAFRFHSLYH